MRYVRAVSIGERMIDDSADEMKDKIRVVIGEAAVKMSAVIGDAIASSGIPRMADSRLLMKVFRVGSSNEWIKVAFAPFQTDVGPLVDHNCEITSIRDEGFLITNACLGGRPGEGI